VASSQVKPAQYLFVDPLSRHLLELARRVARTSVTTLLTGPTGVGKEVLARVLHDASARAAGPFVAINCAAIPESMIEDLLFGHEKGAFTSAIRDHAGVFEQANGGTLFLDEIAEMPVALQARLLRVLQERQITRLGAQAPIEVDVRLVTATNRDLRRAMQAGEFREDLYYRISTFPLRVPPLAERPGDILPIACHLLQMYGGDGRGLTAAAQARLLAHAWPGNVRELGNVIQRALVLADGPFIDEIDLMFEDAGSPGGQVDRVATDIQWSAGQADGAAADNTHERAPSLDDARRSSEHHSIVLALNSAGSREEAARLLGISPRTLRHKIARLREQGYPLASPSEPALASPLGL
jgi:two-component system response regulator FlrC